MALKRRRKAKLKISAKNGPLPCGTTRFIVLHALAGVTAFVAGSAVVFRPTRAHKKSWFDWYLWSLIALVVFMARAIAAHWQQLGGIERLTFSSLFILGLYTLQRANKARLVLEGRDEGWPIAFIDHEGFTLISLFDGFVIVSAIDLGAPGWLVAAVGVLGVVGGIRAIGNAKPRWCQGEVERAGRAHPRRCQSPTIGMFTKCSVITQT